MGGTETKTAFQQVAQEFAAAFETARRDESDPESSYTRLRDAYRDTWAQSLVFDAHADMFPDDWRYACIAAAAEAIAQCEDEDDAQEAVHEFADGFVDVYTAARTAWLASNLIRLGYCDEAAEELGAPGEGVDAGGIVDRIGLGQYFEAGEVFGLVLAGIVARVEGEEGDGVSERERLEYLRGELRAERISWGELAELQSLAARIAPGDVELLEAAGVPEWPDEDGEGEA